MVSRHPRNMYDQGKKYTLIKSPSYINVYGIESVSSNVVTNNKIVLYLVVICWTSIFVCITVSYSTENVKK